VEKGFIWTSFGYELVDPKRWANSLYKSFEIYTVKGKQVNIPVTAWGKL